MSSSRSLGSRGRPRWWRPASSVVALAVLAVTVAPAAADPMEDAPAVATASRAAVVNRCPVPAAGMHAEHGGAARAVALTFDDGPHPEYTPAVLDELDRLGVKATFFLVGRRVERHPAIARSIVERGHAVGNHTHTHPLVPHMDQLPVETRAEQIDRATDAIVAATGVRPCTFRAPGSNHRSEPTQRLANERRLRVVHWTHNGRDDYARTDDRRRAVAEIVGRSTQPWRDRAVVLLHDGGGADTFRQYTVASLEPLVGAYRARGYTFVDAAGAPFPRVDGSLLDACGVPAQTEGDFRDVPHQATHRPAILCAGRWGVASGRSDGRFAPQAAVTRAQVATMLHGLLGAVGHRTAGATRVHFSDVGGSVHRDAIGSLAAAGVLAGRADGSFGPNEPVRRDQLASMLARALDLVAGRRAPSPVRFSDVSRDSVHADAIGRLAGEGVVRGVTDRTFSPDAAVTRGQVATFTMRSAALLVREGHGTRR